MPTSPTLTAVLDHLQIETGTALADRINDFVRQGYRLMRADELRPHDRLAVTETVFGASLSQFSEVQVRRLDRHVTWIAVDTGRLLDRIEVAHDDVLLVRPACLTCHAPLTAADPVVTTLGPRCARHY